MSSRQQIAEAVFAWFRQRGRDASRADVESLIDALTALSAADLDRARVDGIIQAAATIPTTWLDELLTGDDKTLHGKPGTWGCFDIERLLGAVRERILAASPDPNYTKRLRDEALEEAARIAEKPRVVFGTPLTAMHELAQDIAAEIRAKKGTR